MEQFIQIVFPFVFNLAKYFILAGIPFLIFYKLYNNQFVKNKIQEKSAKRKDFIREVLHSLQATMIIVLVALVFLQTPLREYTQIYENIADYPTWWIPVSLILALVIHDTYFYWMHRTLHHPKLYKHTHLVHHQSTNPSPWASFSFHAFESVAEGLVVPVILFTLPMHKITLLMFGLLSTMINVYGHLGFEIAPKWYRQTWLFQILNTSVHHNLHHEKFIGNFGLYFRFWDRLMGTEHPDYVKKYDEIQERRFGKNTPSFKTKWITPIVILFILFSFSAMSQSTIEGKWKDVETGGTIFIFQQEGKYFGQLIGTDTPENDKKIQGKTVFILKDFEMKNEKEFCCGTVFQPKSKRTVSGKIKLINPTTLNVTGRKGFISRTKKFVRL